MPDNFTNSFNQIISDLSSNPNNISYYSTLLLLNYQETIQYLKSIQLPITFLDSLSTSCFFLHRIALSELSIIALTEYKINYFPKLLNDEIEEVVNNTLKIIYKNKNSINEVNQLICNIPNLINKNLSNSLEIRINLLFLELGIKQNFNLIIKNVNNRHWRERLAIIEYFNVELNSGNSVEADMIGKIIELMIYDADENVRSELTRLTCYYDWKQLAIALSDQSEQVRMNVIRNFGLKYKNDIWNNSSAAIDKLCCDENSRDLPCLLNLPFSTNFNNFINTSRIHEIIKIIKETENKNDKIIIKIILTEKSKKIQKESLKYFKSIELIVSLVNDKDWRIRNICLNSLLLLDESAITQHFKILLDLFVDQSNEIRLRITDLFTKNTKYKKVLNDNLPYFVDLIKNKKYLIRINLIKVAVVMEWYGIVDKLKSDVNETVLETLINEISENKKYENIIGDLCVCSNNRIREIAEKCINKF